MNNIQHHLIVKDAVKGKFRGNMQSATERGEGRMMQEFVQQISDTVKRGIRGIHTAMPGKVLAFDPAKCIATVQPAMKFKKPDGKTMDFPQITGVPVVFPQGAGQNAVVAFPVKAGDGCLIVVAEQSLDYWQYVRGYGPAPDFEDARLYDMARDLLRKYSPETLDNVDLSDDNELSCAVSEMLFDGTDTMEGVIALLYTMAWAFAETRERLRMYEETRLSPLDLKDRLIAPFQNDMFAMVWGAFKKLYPDKDCEVYWEPQIRDEEGGKPVYGLTDFADDGSVAVFVKPSLEVADAVEILAHELAHVAVGVEHDHDEVWQEAFDKIYEEYNRIGSQMFPDGAKCAMDDPDGE